MTFSLQEHQVKAIKELDTGKVLVGGVGVGKSITALAYFSKKAPEKPIIALTTAKKRDSGEWYHDALKMSLRANLEVDSWNNIAKYEHITGANFIFDEQRIVGSGAWVKSFYKIAAQNDWILLSATPADTWMDLIPLFIANGYFDNKTQFNNEHVRFSRYTKYPKVDGYYGVKHLEKLRDHLFVDMPYLKKAERCEIVVPVKFDSAEQITIYTKRWNPFEDEPIKDAGEMMRLLRKSTNLHKSRYEKILELIEKHPKLIIFYNLNYELELLRCLMTELDIPMAEWNGHNHQPIPRSDSWIYLVQYQAGSEGWNCVETDTIVFYSLPYSYRNLEQAKGRIDRLNTTFETLYYYIFRSSSIMDRSINNSLTHKKNFNGSRLRKKWEEKQKTL